MFEDMLDGRGGALLTAILGVSIALLALVVVFWLMKARSERGERTKGGRGRMPRLGVLDVVAVDTRRRLVLIRRDDVEHLVMIGGPTDIVIETRIAVDRAPRLGAASREEGLAAAPHSGTHAEPAQRPGEPERRPAGPRPAAMEPAPVPARPKAVTERPAAPAPAQFVPASAAPAPQALPPAQFPPERFTQAPVASAADESQVARQPVIAEPAGNAGGITAGNPFEEAEFSAVLDAQMQKAFTRGRPSSEARPQQATIPAAAPHREASQVAPAVESPAAQTDEGTLQEEMAKLLADMAANKR